MPGVKADQTMVAMEAFVSAALPPALRLTAAPSLCFRSDRSLTGPVDASLALELVLLSPQTEWTCRDRRVHGEAPLSRRR